MCSSYPSIVLTLELVLSTIFLLCSVSQIVGPASQGGHDIMLEGVHMTQGSGYTYATFIDNGLFIAIRRTRSIFSFHKGAFYTKLGSTAFMDTQNRVMDILQKDI